MSRVMLPPYVQVGDVTSRCYGIGNQPTRGQISSVGASKGSNSLT